MGENTELLLSIGKKTHSVEVYLPLGDIDRGRKPGVILLLPAAVDATSSNETARWKRLWQRVVRDAQLIEYVLIVFPVWRSGDAAFIGPALDYASMTTCLDKTEIYVLAPALMDELAASVACEYTDRISAGGVVESNMEKTWQELRLARHRILLQGRPTSCQG